MWIHVYVVKPLSADKRITQLDLVCPYEQVKWPRNARSNLIREFGSRIFTQKKPSTISYRTILQGLEPRLYTPEMVERRFFRLPHTVANENLGGRKKFHHFFSPPPSPQSSHLPSSSKHHKKKFLFHIRIRISSLTLPSKTINMAKAYFNSYLSFLFFFSYFGWNLI